MTSSTISTVLPSTASSIASDQTIRPLDQASTPSTTSTASSSPPTISETGSWGAVSSDGKSGSNGAQHGIQIVSTTPDIITRKVEDKDRPVWRNPNTLNAPKRASSLFKVSTVDHSIVQDDDSASLASLAPPVVSLSPAFGDQGTAKDKSPEVSGAMTIRNADNRTPDPSRLSVSKSYDRLLSIQLNTAAKISLIDKH